MPKQVDAGEIRPMLTNDINILEVKSLVLRMLRDSFSCSKHLVVHTDSEKYLTQKV